MRRRLSVFSSLLIAFTAASAASAYELVTRSGEVLEGTGVQFAGEQCVLQGAEGPRRLAAADVDYYQTFRRNAASGDGNVVVFNTGAFLRYEKLELDGSQVVLSLGDDSRVTLPEVVIDFERSVQEASTVRLARAPRADIARSTGGGFAGSARGGGGGGEEDAAAPGPGARGRSFNPRALSGRDRGRVSPSSRTSRRNAALAEDSGGSPSPSALEDATGDYERVEDGPGGDDGSDDSGAGAAEGQRGRDGIGDADDLRRKAEEEGEPTGNVSVIISSNDAVDVAAVQFRLRYPSNCTPVGQAPIGAFANSALAQPNGAVGGRSIYAMAIVFATDASTTSLPGEIARVDFLWRGQPPPAGEFLVISATATDGLGGAVRAFRAEATVLQ